VVASLSDEMLSYLSHNRDIAMLVVLSLGVLLVVGILLLLRWRLTAMAAGQALLAATEAGDLAQMRVLLSRSVAINATNAQGWTPLHVAVAGGDLAVIELLLRHGANVNAASYVGATPLDNAMISGQTKAVLELLRAHGASGHVHQDSLF
jgi:ankyrin repeat protein